MVNHYGDDSDQNFSIANSVYIDIAVPALLILIPIVFPRRN